MIDNITKVITQIENAYIKLFENIDFFSINAQSKENFTSVTKYDLAATKLCIDQIKSEFPQANIWIEEDQKILTAKEDELTWIIDPLDGTASFTRGYPVWGMGISVLKNNIPLYSCFIAPRADLRIHSFENTLYINNKEIDINQIDSKSNIDTKTIFISSRLHKKIAFDKLKDYKLRNFGSTLYHLFMVALGKAESVIISSSYIWDLAAVFHLGSLSGCSFYDYNTDKKVNIQELLNSKNSKIDIILVYKKEYKNE